MNHRIEASQDTFLKLDSGQELLIPEGFQFIRQGEGYVLVTPDGEALSSFTFLSETIEFALKTGEVVDLDQVRFGQYIKKLWNVRQFQKLYFSTRSKLILQAVKREEELLDQMLESPYKDHLLRHEIAQVALEMRFNQIYYFRYRIAVARDEAIRLETRVDRLLSEHMKSPKPELSHPVISK